MRIIQPRPTEEHEFSSSLLLRRKHARLPMATCTHFKRALVPRIPPHQPPSPKPQPRSPGASIRRISDNSKSSIASFRLSTSVPTHPKVFDLSLAKSKWHSRHLRLRCDVRPRYFCMPAVLVARAALTVEHADSTLIDLVAPLLRVTTNCRCHTVWSKNLKFRHKRPEHSRSSAFHR